MAFRALTRPEPTKVGRIALIVAGALFGFAIGVTVGGRLGPDARVGGTLLYPIAMLIGFALLIVANTTRLS
jgi:hypothetical protein